MTRSERDAAYLAEVLTVWRAAFATAEGDNMPELYAAAAHRAAADDWTQLRPLLLVVRTMLRIHTTLVGQIGYSLLQSIEPGADRQTATELLEVSRLLREAQKPLADALKATNPRPGVDGLGAGRPREPTYVIDPEKGGVRGLLDIAAMAGVGTMLGVGIGIGSAVAARLWWRGTPPPSPVSPTDT